MDRRGFFKTATVTAAGTALATTHGGSAGAAHAPAVLGTRNRKPTPPHITWTIFTRHLQWLTTQADSQAQPYATGVLIGEKAAELGYTAVNLTVRRSGHVDPSLVDVRQNLPLMLEGVRSTG